MSRHQKNVNERNKYLDGQLTMPAGTTASGGQGDNSTSPNKRDIILHHETNRLIKRRVDDGSILKMING